MNNLTALERRLLTVLIGLVLVVGVAVYISARLDSFSAQQRDLSLTPAVQGLTPNNPSGAGSTNQAQAPGVSPTQARRAGATPSAVPSQDVSADLQAILKGEQKPALKLLHGQPAFSQGFVSPSSAQGLTLQVGNDALQSYNATFDIKHPSEHWELMVTAGKNVMGAITPSGATWYSNQGGGWQVVATGPGVSSPSETLSFSVENSTLIVKVNGLPFSTVTTNAPLSGPLVINLSQQVSLGNLELNSR